MWTSIPLSVRHPGNCEPFFFASGEATRHGCGEEALKFATDGARFSEFIIGNFLQMWPTNPLFLAKVIFIGDALLSVRCHRWTRRGVSLWIDISTVDYCRSSTCHDITMLRLLYFLYFYTFSGVSRVSNAFADSYNIWDSTHGVFSCQKSCRFGSCSCSIFNHCFFSKLQYICLNKYFNITS